MYCTDCDNAYEHCLCPIKPEVIQEQEEAQKKREVKNRCIACFFAPCRCFGKKPDA